ncbi:MAG: GTPase ObgE, partial [Chloroflexi bacterium]|nr:GTPase ObgE [Chloroflexota bacterium]
MKNKVKIILTSGSGGAGCVSFRKEKFVSRGGPDGGDGGDGGDVVLIPNKDMYDLDCFYNYQKFNAGSGEPGGKKNKNGKRGNDLELTLPFNCEINISGETKIILNKKTVFLKGGEKGKGNIKFKSSINQEPLLAEYGG